MIDFQGFINFPWWCRKVEQVVEEANSLKESLDRHSLRHQKWILEAKEREELLERAV